MLEDKAQNVVTDVRALLPLIVSNTLNALGAILILLIGLWLSGRADLLVVTTLRRAPHVDPMLQSFFGSLVRYPVLIVTALAVLSEFGTQTTSLVAILGAASLAMGLALRGTLSDLAAGVMLLIFRPFRIGHKVQIDGTGIGTVIELSLFWTELVTVDVRGRGRRPSSASSSAAPSGLARGPDQMPIRSAARGGGDQEMFPEDGPIGYTPRPANLGGVRSAYAIYMVGDSMEPRWEPGWLLHVNPFKPVTRARDVVLAQELGKGVSGNHPPSLVPARRA
jgi:hypothetical protein